MINNQANNGKKDVVEALLKENEANANRTNAKIILGYDAINVFWCATDYLFYKNYEFPLPIFAVMLLLSLFITFFTIRDSGKGRYYSTALLISPLLFSFMMVCFSIHKYYAVIMFPVLMAILYRRVDITKMVCITDTVLMIAALAITKAEPNLFVAYIVMEIAVWFTVTEISKLGVGLLTRMATIMEDRDEAKQAAHDMKTNIMISQIQPHFLYNTLMAITGIEGNPPETMEAIADFGQYLRENLYILQTKGAIPFEDEIRHVELYVSLEKLRFEDKLTVNMDLEETDFAIPPLTLQMIVENAIKHGVSKRPEGGTVNVKTEREGNNVIIVVDDDGIGFDKRTAPIERSGHIGLRSVRERLEEMVDGTMEIFSIKGTGTKVTLTIPLDSPKQKEYTSLDQSSTKKKPVEMGETEAEKEE